MMSSVGGRNAMPFLGAYSASKFGLEGFSESLRRELMVFGIDVVVIAPGAVATPIWHKREGADLRSLANTAFGPGLAALLQFSEESARHVPAAGADRRSGVAGADGPSAADALHRDAGADAALRDEMAPETSGRPSDRAPPRVDETRCGTDARRG